MTNNKKACLPVYVCVICLGFLNPTIYLVKLELKNAFLMMNEGVRLKEDEGRIDAELLSPEANNNEFFSSDSPKVSLNEQQEPFEVSVDQSRSVFERNISHRVDLLERCRCGCVPNVMSLFEMAELRARRKKERADAEDLQKEKRHEKE